MNWLEAAILGFIQGLTEFLPISSTGHLYLGRKIFGLQDAGLFLDTMLHIGTFIALIVFYKDILWKLAKRPFSKLVFLLAAGTIPAVIAGLLFKDFFDGISKTGMTIGWEFIFTALCLLFADRVKKGARKLDDLTFSDALWIGSFQALAIFPAVSRSGLTIAGALMRGIDKETAAYFSFLLSIPAVFGALLFQLKDLAEYTGPSIGFPAMLIATIASAIFGYLAVAFMINFVKNHSLKWFALYVLVLGAGILLLQGMKIF
ncbi:undecaprenyl-diphosphate phosphatase [Metabacillus sp. KIGAM252]|uniref:Undecaprenyl-diphosphatase n=1 Tax=Metabacillus flavus TaxID=2823519 RepID=A0ABS5LCR3_9BACI|nr:undecaprenyl-diphosphate phosphatase [Metabacillus flavus]MBS2968532.1 undecaprenyl-diphosphate phosphatase [Metabacillus flavus]